MILVIGYGRLLIYFTKRSFELTQGQGGIAEECREADVTEVIVDEMEGKEGRNVRKIYVLSQSGEKSEIELSSSIK